MHDFSLSFGRNLKILRTRYGYSQHAIACVLNVSYQQIQKYETGTNRLSAEGLFILKHFYDVPYDVFFENCKNLTACA